MGVLCKRAGKGIKNGWGAHFSEHILSILGYRMGYLEFEFNSEIVHLYEEKNQILDVVSFMVYRKIKVKLYGIFNGA